MEVVSAFAMQGLVAVDLALLLGREEHLDLLQAHVHPLRHAVEVEQVLHVDGLDQRLVALEEAVQSHFVLLRQPDAHLLEKIDKLVLLEHVLAVGLFELSDQQVAVPVLDLLL